MATPRAATVCDVEPGSARIATKADDSEAGRNATYYGGYGDAGGSPDRHTLGQGLAGSAAKGNRGDVCARCFPLDAGRGRVAKPAGARQATDQGYCRRDDG